MLAGWPDESCGVISTIRAAARFQRGRSAWARPKPTVVSVISYKKSYPGLYAPPANKGKVNLWGQGELFKEDRVMEDDSPGKLKQEAWGRIKDEELQPGHYGRVSSFLWFGSSRDRLIVQYPSVGDEA